MNQLLVNSDAATISSLEIARLSGKEHARVMREIKVMLNKLESMPNAGDQFSYQGTHTHPCNNQTFPHYNLPRRECLILISGYTFRMRVSIIDRLLELEKSNS